MTLFRDDLDVSQPPVVVAATPDDTPTDGRRLLRVLPAVVVALLPFMFYSPVTGDFHVAVSDLVFPFLAAYLLVQAYGGGEPLGGIVPLIGFTWVTAIAVVASTLTASLTDDQFIAFSAIANAFKLGICLLYAIAFARVVAISGVDGLLRLLKVWTWAAGLLAAGSILTVLGIARLMPADQWGRSGGYFQDPNYLAAYLLVSVSAVIVRHALEPWRWTPLFLAVLAAGIVTSASRGGVAALVVVFALGGFLIRSRAIRVTMVSLTALAIVVLGAVTSGVLAGRGFATFDRLYRSTNAVGDDGRFTLWRIALGLFSDHPIFGIGLGQFPRFSKDAFGLSSRGDTSQGLVAHNTFLSFLAEMGIIGGLLCVVGVAMLSVAILGNRLLGSQARNGLVLGLAAIIFETMSLNLQNLRFVWVFIGIAVGAACLKPADPGPDDTGPDEAVRDVSRPRPTPERP